MKNISELIRRNSLVATAIVRVLNILIIGISAIVFARTLGSIQYGILTSILAFSAIVAVPLELGLGTLMARQVAVLVVGHHVDAAAADVRRSAKLFLIVNGVVLSITLFLWFLFRNIDITITYGIIIASLLAALSFLSGSYRGFGHPAMSSLINTVIRPSIAVLLVLTLLLSSGRVEIQGALIIQVISGIAGIGIGVILIGRAIAPKHWLSAPHSDVRTNLGMHAHLIGLGLLQSLSGNIEPLILRYFSGAEEVSYFRLAFLIGFMCQAPLGVFSTVVGPNVAALWAHGRSNDLLSLLKRSTARSVILSMALIVPALASIPWLVPLLFGHDLGGAVFPAMVFVILMIPYSFLGLAGTILTMTGAEKSALAYTAWGYLVSGLIMGILAAKWGAVAGVLGSGIALLVQNFLMHLRVRKMLGEWAVPGVGDVMKELAWCWEIGIKAISGTAGQK